MSMERKQLLAALQHLSVETGSLACLGCGYEHNCTTKGCRLLREAVQALSRTENEKEGDCDGTPDTRTDKRNQNRVLESRQKG